MWKFNFLYHLHECFFPSEQQPVTKVSSEPAITEQTANVTEATLVTSASIPNEDDIDDSQQHNEHEEDAVEEVETVVSDAEEEISGKVN